MQLTLSQIAELVGGEIRPKDGTVPIRGASILRDAQAGEITFVDDAKHLEALTAGTASAVVVPPDLTPQQIPYVRVHDVREAFARIVTYFRPRPDVRLPGISPRAHVSDTAAIAPDAQIYPGATIGDQVTIGPGCVVHAGATVMAGCTLDEKVTIFPNAVLYENTRIGARSIVHAGAVLGAYGFGYESTSEGHRLCAQLGYVEVGEDVEIGAGTTIDRGTFGATYIGDGTKIDNLVQVGHNCRIGRHNLLCSQVGIAGSCSTGDFVVMAGQVGVRDHVQIGDAAMLGAKSGVSEDLPGNQAYLGAPALPARTQMQILFSLQRLPELRKQVREMARHVTTADTPRELRGPVGPHDAPARRTEAA